MNLKQKVRWNSTVKVITWIVVPLLMYAEYILINQLLHQFDIVSLLASIGLPVILLYFLLQMATFVELTENQLIIHRLRGNLIISIQSIKNINFPVGQYGIRLFGSGGLFGYIGLFYNRQIGNFYSYIGNRSQSFWIETENGKKYALSCENRDLVIQAIQNQITK
ncbi:MAG: PH domain-containing protein [Candidatus Symbiothrix sp.]|jgi:hypothetical protein|nr:PH domain-containing protein [Candidatus Symbiothrix sp.]